MSEAGGGNTRGRRPDAGGPGDRDAAIPGFSDPIEAPDLTASILSSVEARRGFSARRQRARVRGWRTALFAGVVVVAGGAALMHRVAPGGVGVSKPVSGVTQLVQAVEQDGLGLQRELRGVVAKAPVDEPAEDAPRAMLVASRAAADTEGSVTATLRFSVDARSSSLLRPSDLDRPITDVDIAATAGGTRMTIEAIGLAGGVSLAADRLPIGAGFVATGFEAVRPAALSSPAAPAPGDAWTGSAAGVRATGFGGSPVRPRQAFSVYSGGPYEPTLREIFASIGATPRFDLGPVLDAARARRPE